MVKKTILTFDAIESSQYTDLENVMTSSVEVHESSYLENRMTTTFIVEGKKHEPYSFIM